MIYGATAQLGKMAARLRELADVPARAARAVAEDLEQLVEEEFDAGTDPYGKSWKPLAPRTLARGRTPPPLTDKGIMRGTLRVQPLPGAGVGVTIDHPAGVHQTGWDGSQGAGPSRPILPSRNALPASWREAMAREAKQAFEGITRR